MQGKKILQLAVPADFAPVDPHKVKRKWKEREKKKSNTLETVTNEDEFPLASFLRGTGKSQSFQLDKATTNPFQIYGHEVATL